MNDLPRFDILSNEHYKRPGPSKAWSFKHVYRLGRHFILMFRSPERLKNFCIPPVFDERDIRIRLGDGCGHWMMIPPLS